MALPSNVVRSYGGGAVQAQLVEDLGVSDTSFAITTTVGWVENGTSNPLGTSGPFTVIIDRGTGTVEKILCSAVNLTTGIVTVWTSGGSGRGYDGTTAQEHAPNGSPSGVQTTWPSVEADEANDAVVAVLGGTPSNGEVLTWSSGAPAYVAPASGVAAYAQVTSPTSGITSATNISGLSISVTVTAGQTVKVTAFTPDFSAAGGALATDQYFVGILEGSTVLNGVQLLSGSGGGPIAVLTPSAGAHTYFVQANHTTGGTAGIFGAAATSPAFILAEVIG